MTELDVLLRRDRLFRTGPDLRVPAQRVSERAPLVDGVLGETGDERVDVLPLPHAAVDVKPRSSSSGVTATA